MQVIKCDRCGKVYEKDGKEGKVIHIREKESAEWGKQFDICDDCIKSFIKWTEGEKE